MASRTSRRTASGWLWRSAGTAGPDAGQGPPGEIGVGPFEGGDPLLAGDDLEAGGGEHLLGDIGAGDVVELPHRSQVVGGSMAGERLEAGAQIERRPGSPEGDGEQPARAQDASGLVHGSVTATPDAVDRHRGVEGGVGPRQLEHRAESDVRVGVAGAGDVDQFAGGVDPGHVGAHGAGAAEGEAGPAGDVKQPHTGPDTDMVEGAGDGLGGVGLEQAGPVVGGVAPRGAGLLPVVSARAAGRLGRFGGQCGGHGSTLRSRQIQVLADTWGSGGGRSQDELHVVATTSSAGSCMVRPAASEWSRRERSTP